MNETVERIKNKIALLKKLDKNCCLFGSKNHRYQLNPTISIDIVRRFESAQDITLPNDYVVFLTNIGNGGAGPFYGLESLENSLFDDLDFKRTDSLLDPSKPFPHTEPWNMDFHPTVDEDEDEEEYQRQFEAFQDKYYDKEHMNGAIAVCNYGCAVSLNLVVNGQEYGNIWTDGRGSDNGIYPSNELGNKDRVTFLNWYELWLDNSLTEIKSKLSSFEIERIGKMDKKPWWKIF